MPNEFQPGQIVGVWELVRPLGAGAFGEVWLARHTELGHELALKIPTDPEFVRQLRMEGQLQFNLRHPNIVVTHPGFTTWRECVGVVPGW